MFYNKLFDCVENQLVLNMLKKNTKFYSLAKRFMHLIYQCKERVSLLI